MNAQEFARRPATSQPAAPGDRRTPQLHRGWGLLRHSSRDGWLVVLALLHGVLILWRPSVAVIALGLWWNANTISHNFIHLPFFRSRPFNALFSIYLTVLLGFPQSFWAARHLAHHRDEGIRWKDFRRAWLMEAALVLIGWGLLVIFCHAFFVGVYLPGWLIGIGLCQVQGYFEHSRGGAVSHHGWIYNRLFFNDGHHIEHHARPGLHWTALGQGPLPDESRLSRWPPVLRWLEYASLDGLKKLARLISRRKLAGFRGPAQTNEPRASMKALALFATLLVAKLIAVAGRELPWSIGTPLALFWQDALLALLFAAVDWGLRRKPWLNWSLFWVLAFYTAVNVVATRVLSSPLTWQMSRAAGGALSDSIRHYITPTNLALIASVLLSAAAFAAISRKDFKYLRHAGLGLLSVLALGGLLVSGTMDCSGLQRNAVLALVDSMVPRVREKIGPPDADWRRPVGDERQTEDLTPLRGAAAGRNVVLIALESTGARALRLFGADRDPMPNLTKFGRDSLLFDNACAVYPESIKGLFSVMCSRFPAFDTRAEDYARVRTPGIAAVLAKAGYRTALFHSGRFMYLGMDAILRNRGFEILEDAGAIGGNFNSSFGVDEPATVMRMLSWIDTLPAGERFFLHYLPIAGHHPYATPAPGPFPGSTDAGQYLNALHFGDESLGAFLNGLRQRGLDTNTLFVIYGDHGEAFGQHDGNYGHTLFIYEENIHVPLMIALPGRTPYGRHLKKVASLIDLGPTLLDLAGIASPVDYQGVSLLEPREQAALFFTDYSLPLAGVRDGRWKLIQETGSSRWKLYDLQADPLETRNVAGQFPGIVAAWGGRLNEWTAAQKALVRGEM